MFPSIQPCMTRALDIPALQGRRRRKFLKAWMGSLLEEIASNLDSRRSHGSEHAVYAVHPERPRSHWLPHLAQVKIRVEVYPTMFFHQSRYKFLVYRGRGPCAPVDPPLGQPLAGPARHGIPAQGAVITDIGLAKLHSTCLANPIVLGTHVRLR